MQVAEHFFQREGVLAAERQDDALLGRRRLKLEIEALAEFLPERESPSAVDAAAERRGQHELHAAGLVEEALERKLVDGRHDAKAALRFGEVLRDLLGRRALKALVALQERDSRVQFTRLARFSGPRQLQLDGGAQVWHG